MKEKLKTSRTSSMLRQINIHCTFLSLRREKKYQIVYICTSPMLAAKDLKICVAEVKIHELKFALYSSCFIAIVYTLIKGLTCELLIKIIR